MSTNDVLRVSRACGEDPSMDEIAEMLAAGEGAVRERQERLAQEVFVRCAQEGIALEHVAFVCRTLAAAIGPEVVEVQQSILAMADLADPEDAVPGMLGGLLSFSAWFVALSSAVYP